MAEARFELYGVVGLLLVATENLAIERGLGYSALNEAEPVAPAFLSALAVTAMVGDGLMRPSRAARTDMFGPLI